MIDIAKLTKNDIGRWVTYDTGHNYTETGKIKSWNKSGIFVVYNCGEDWKNYKDYTAAHTNPNDLEFRD